MVGNRRNGSNFAADKNTNKTFTIMNENLFPYGTNQNPETTPPPVPQPTERPVSESYQPADYYQPAFEDDDVQPQAESPYSFSSLVSKLIILLLVSAGVAFVVYMIDNFALNRSESGTLLPESFDKFNTSTVYSFALSAIAMGTLLLIDIRFRRTINYLQYTLIACSLACGYLLMLSFAELMTFTGAYIISSFMTIILLAAFVNSLFHKPSATTTLSLILLAEYGILFGLVNIGTFALLAGSLLVFALIACAMYFSQKMKITDGEVHLD